MKNMNKEEKATALKYNGDMEAPLILYNGRGRFVQSMLEIAKKRIFQLFMSQKPKRFYLYMILEIMYQRKPGKF